MMMQVVPLQPMKDYVGVNIHNAAHEGYSQKQMYMLWRKLQIMEISHKSRLLAETVANGEKPTWEKVSWQLLWPCRGPMMEQFVPEGLSYGKKVCWSSILWEAPHAGAGEEHEEETTAVSYVSWHTMVWYNMLMRFFIFISSVKHFHPPSFLLTQGLVFQQAVAHRQWKHNDKAKRNTWAKAVRGEGLLIHSISCAAFSSLLWRHPKNHF